MVFGTEIYRPTLSVYWLLGGPESAGIFLIQLLIIILFLVFYTIYLERKRMRRGKYLDNLSLAESNDGQGDDNDDDHNDSKKLKKIKNNN